MSKRRPDMGKRSKEYVRFRRALTLGYLALFLLLAALLGWKVFTEYRSDRNAAAAVAQISAKAMAAHVEEIIDAIDQSLKASADGIAAMKEGPINPQSVQPLLAASTLASDSRFWLLFIDASGRGVVASNGLAVGGVSFTDRSYFVDPAAERSNRLHMGGPSEGRVSKRKIFFLSRRVESPSGKFLGVVAAPVDASRVASVFERARLGSAMSIALATRGGVVIARAPKFEESFGADLSRPIAAANPPGPSVAFETRSPFDGERRMFSYAPVGSFPLLLVVGLTRESWMANFRSDALAGVIALAIALAAAMISVGLALRQYLRLERVEAWQRRLIEQLAAAKEELARGEMRLRFIADSVPARVAYINADERYLFHNNGREKAPLGAIMGKTILETYGPVIYALIQEDVHRVLAGEPVSVERRYSLNGQDRHFKHQYDPDFDKDGRVIGFYAMVTDITEFKTIQRKLSDAAQLDSLTGLPNRAGLHDRLEAALARSRRNGSSLACLYLDIDKFKDVNDTFGHLGGDSVLIEFGRRLSQCVRESDTVARLAGDEFVIVLEELDRPAEARLVALKVLASMRTPFKIDEESRVVTTSIGIAFADSLACDPTSLLRAADLALYQAKREGRDRMWGDGAGAEDEGASRP